MSPLLSYAANVRSMDSASSYLPVEMHTPGSAIMVSLPQSSKKGYPASIVFPPVDALREINWSALFESVRAFSSRKPASSSSPFRYVFSPSMIRAAISLGESIISRDESIPPEASAISRGVFAGSPLLSCPLSAPLPSIRYMIESTFSQPLSTQILIWWHAAAEPVSLLPSHAS